MTYRGEENFQINKIVTRYALIKGPLKALQKVDITEERYDSSCGVIAVCKMCMNLT